MRVLIADDEAVIRMGLRAMLEAGGQRVVGAAVDGAAAVELARTEKPDVIILDIKMPGLDGLQAARKIMQERPTPIVMLTAYSQRELIEQAKAAAVFAYLVKPVKEELLKPTLELAVARFKQWQKLNSEVKDLEASLAARDVIEKAKRRLVEHEHLSEQQAFNKIHRASRTRRIPMQQVAQEILDRAAPKKKS